MALFEGYSFISDEVNASYQILDDVNVFALAGTQGLKASKSDTIAFDRYSDSAQVAFSYLGQYDNKISCLPTFSGDTYLVLKNFDRFGGHYLWDNAIGSLHAFQDNYGNTIVGSRNYCYDANTYIVTDIQYVFEGITPRDLGLGSVDFYGHYSVSRFTTEWLLGSSDFSKDELLALAQPTPEPTPEPSPNPTPEPTPEPTPIPSPEPDCGDSTDVFRFYNAATGVHFFTPSPGEKDDIISKPEWGYKYEGVAYKAPTDTGTELYRFYNRDKGYHFLTASKAEADSLTGMPEWGYKYEGRSYKVTQQATSETPNEVHRFYNRGKGIHFYSASDAEANNIIANSLGSGFDLSNALKEDDLLPGGWGYIYEGAAWYVTDC